MFSLLESGGRSTPSLTKLHPVWFTRHHTGVDQTAGVGLVAQICRSMMEDDAVALLSDADRFENVRRLLKKALDHSGRTSGQNPSVQEIG
jgi:hypothetical protein